MALTESAARAHDMWSEQKQRADAAEAERDALRDELIEHRRALWMLAWAAPEHAVFVTREAAEAYRSDAILKTWAHPRTNELMITAELPSRTEKE